MHKFYRIARFNEIGESCLKCFPVPPKFCGVINMMCPNEKRDFSLSLLYMCMLELVEANLLFT